VVRRLVQTLAAPSVFSQRYGAGPEPKAERAAAAVEAEAFVPGVVAVPAASPASPWARASCQVHPLPWP